MVVKQHEIQECVDERSLYIALPALPCNTSCQAWRNISECTAPDPSGKCRAMQAAHWLEDRGNLGGTTGALYQGCSGIAGPWKSSYDVKKAKANCRRQILTLNKTTATMWQKRNHWLRETWESEPERAWLFYIYGFTRHCHMIYCTTGVLCWAMCSPASNKIY